MTKHYFKLMIIFLILSAICLFGPISVFFLRAFVVGDTAQKLTMGVTFTIALILFIINLIMKSHLRSVIWVLLLGVFAVIDHYLLIIIVFAVCCFLEELIFSPLYRYYKNKVRINKEIDKRIGST
ncbi:MAG: hypothetical protein IKE94_07385 [Aeriscardovia sp.]|nr:hypothetical protein [Aeriscardovia sp.]